jgi:Caspase domain
MITIDNCALFIGVDDYRAFDASMKNPPGKSELFGSRNDAHAFLRVCRELGFRPENVQILTSPKFDPAALGLSPEQVGEADEAGILDGARWLAGKLGAPERPSGLFTYSGHGDFLEGEGLVLCPSDTTGPNLQRSIPFSTLHRIFAEHRALDNLTVVLDCCHSGAAGASHGKRPTSLTGRPLPADLLTKIPALGDRQLSACGPQGTAWQSRFSGVPRGAFSWALGAVMNQWKAEIEGGGVQLDLAYGDAVDRSRRLLDALSFDEVPQLSGRAGVEAMPFFCRNAGGACEPTSADPDRHRRSDQLTPDVKYNVALSTSRSVWTIFATGSAPPAGTTAFTEYWQMDATFAAAVASQSGSITFNGQSMVSTDVPAPSAGFAMPTTATWSPCSAPTGSAFWNAASTVGLVFNGLTAPATASQVWSGTVTWYDATTSGAPPSAVVPSGSTPMTWAPARAGSYQWYSMTLPLLTWSAAPTGAIESASGVALASLGSTLYLAYNDSSTVYARTSTDGATWSSRTSTGAGTGLSPALAPLGSTLYLAYKSGAASGYTTIHTRTCRGGAWSDLMETNVSTSGAPALGSGPTSDGRSTVLAMAYPNSTNTCVRVSTNGSTWSSAGGPGTASSGTPSVCWFGGSLYLAFVSGSSGNIEIYKATSVTTTATAWSSTPTAVLSAIAGCANPCLFAYNGLLFLSANDTSQNAWLGSTSDGASWSGFSELTSQVPSVTTGIGAALGAASTGALVLGYVASSDGQVRSLPTVIPTS